MLVVTANNKFFKNLIVFALVLSVFTSLRFSFLGIGELIFIILGGISLLQLWKKPSYKDYLFSGFWLFYLVLSIVGGLYNNAANLDTGTFSGAIFDFAAYCMLFISCLSIERRFVLHQDDAYSYIRAIFYFFVSILTILYFLSFFTSTIVGLPIRYYQYFSPLVSNLHQAAMILTPMPFIGSLILDREKNRLLKLFIVSLIILSVLMIMATGSSKAILGVLMGVIGYTIAKTYRYSLVYSVIIFILVSCFLLVIFTFYVDLIGVTSQLFNQHDGGGGRTYLYSSAIILIKESWLFGRGTGPHIYYLGEFNDSHQTLLTVMLQVGIVGFTLFIRLLYKILQRGFYTEPIVFAAFLSIMAYVGGGDILRRLPVWGILIILYFVACQTKPNLITRSNQ